MSNKQRFGGIWNLWNWKHQDSSIRYTNFDLGGVGYIITTVSFFFKIDFSEFSLQIQSKSRVVKTIKVCW